MDQTFPQRRSQWIISPLADLVCLVGTPLAIFPCVMYLSGYVLTPEQLAVGVLAFASFGHHLPGFLRAYGDRDLFRRHFWRFVLAPPLILATVVLFAGLNLHGFTLILLVWATWHILMQTYGFLRIYDSKRGNSDSAAARFDFLACAAIFANGILFSDARVYGFAEELALVGLPTLLPWQLETLRWAVGSATVALAAAYVVRLWCVSRSPSGMSWPKVLLLTTTGLLYWSSGLLSTNLLVGVAMFEIFHAVQYFAVVWIYNRRVAERESHRLRPIAWLFRRSVLSICLYLCAIALFGATFLAARSIDSAHVQQALLILFSSSACLHFYYDGFIWKIRQGGTRSDLQIGSLPNPTGDSPAGRWHALKWVAVGALALGLGLLEANAPPRNEADEHRLLMQLQLLTPELPELQVRLAQSSRRRGETQRAIAFARQAVEGRPNMQGGHAELGAALLHQGKFGAAAASLRTANELGPRSWQIELDLAQALQGLRDFPGAESCYKKADQLEPHNGEIHTAWAGMCRQRGEADVAIEHYTSAIAGYDREFSRNTASDKARAKLADAIYERGVTRQQCGAAEASQADFERTLDVQPTHARALFQVGNASLLAGDLDAAVTLLERSVASDPALHDGFNSLGAAFYEQGRLQQAAEAYSQAIALRSDFAPSHFNLGLVHLEQRELEQARRCIERASQLGQSVPPEIADEIGLEQ